MPASLWYPPARWQPGETVVLETIPWFLPRTWAPVVTVTAVTSTGGGRALLPASAGDASDCTEGSEALCITGEQLRLSAWVRRDGRLALFHGPENPIEADVRFSAPDWAVRLSGYTAPLAVAPGRALPVMLRWTSEGGPASRDYTVFLHLRDGTGRTVAGGDATPAWFTPWPTSQWLAARVSGWDAHTVTVPAGLPPGRYDLVVGWYDWETSERLQVGSADEVPSVREGTFPVRSSSWGQWWWTLRPPRTLTLVA